MDNETTTLDTANGGRARWTRLAVVGFLMEFVAVALMLSAALLGDGPNDEMGFFIIVGAIPLVGAFLVWSFGSWAKLVGVVLALLPAVGMFWTAFGLKFPQSFFDFVPGALLIPGGIIAAVACIAAFVAGRRGHTEETASGGERRAIRVVEVLILVIAATSAALTYTGKSASPSASADAVINAVNFKFEPEKISVDGGSTVNVKNKDLFFHTFTIDELDVRVELSPGDEVAVQIPDRAGSYTMYCEPHTSDSKDPGEHDMAGTLNVS